MNITSSRNMELIDRYMQAVGFWVPKTNRHEDLLAELGEDLRAQIVVLGDSVRESSKYLPLVKIVNVSMLLGVAGTWIGLCIAAIVQTWEFLRHLRRRNSGTQQPAQPRAA